METLLDIDVLSRITNGPLAEESRTDLEWIGYLFAAATNAAAAVSAGNDPSEHLIHCGQLAAGWVRAQRTGLPYRRRADCQKFIVAEAHRAYVKHGNNSLLGNGLTPVQRCAALFEEIGEVAAELTHDKGEDGALETELIQVASVCASWATWLKKPEPDPRKWAFAFYAGSAIQIFYSTEGGTPDDFRARLGELGFDPDKMETGYGVIDSADLRLAVVRS